MNWVLKLIFVLVCELLTGIVEYLEPIISNIFDFMYQVNVDLGLDGIADYTQGLGLALLAAFAVKQGIDVYFLHVDGDPDADPLELVTRVAIATATMMCGVDIIKFLIGKASIICAEAVKSIGYDGRTATEIITDAFMKFLSVGTIVVVVQSIFLAITVIALLIFVIKAAKRGAELILFQIMLPLVALDMLTTSREKWNAFRNELIICIFGYILQVLSFNIFMILLSKAITVDGVVESPSSIIATMGWLIVVLSAPKWLQKFMYSSGVGNGVKSGATMGAHMIPMLLRR